MKLTRRQPLQTAVASSTIATLNPKLAFGAADKAENFRVAGVGIGGRGKADLSGMKGHPRFELAAIADVDNRFYKVADGFGKDVKKFQDYRKMFEQEADNFDGLSRQKTERKFGSIPNLQ